MTVLGYLVFAAREIVPRTPEEPQLCGTTVTDILLHLRGKAPRWKYIALCRHAPRALRKFPHGHGSRHHHDVGITR